MALEIGGEYSLPEVTVCNETSLEKQETDQSQLCLCPALSFDLEEIKKKLTDYNRILKNPQIRMQEFGYNGKTRECIRRLTKKLEELILCIFTSDEPYLYSFLMADACSYIKLIFHHVLMTTEHAHSEKGEYTLLSHDEYHNTWYCQLKSYFDLYYEDTNPEVSFDLIHTVWKYHPGVELNLRLLCCKSLLENQHYDKLDQFIRNNDEYLFINLKNNTFDQSEYGGIQLTLSLILLSYYVTSRQIEKYKTILMLIENIISSRFSYTYLSIKNGFNDFMLLAIRKKQIRTIPWLFELLQPELNRSKHLKLEITSLYYARLLEVNCHEESMDFIKDSSHFILNVPFFLEERACYARQKLCILLLNLLHAYMMCEDFTNMHHVMNRLQEFRQSLLLPTDKSCACFIGKHDCNHKEQSFNSCFSNANPDRKNTSTKSSFMTLTINDLRGKVIKEELSPVEYLKPMIDAAEKYPESREDFREDFILFIEQISAHNETGLYNIIKTLCDLEMQPEIQDMFIQGLTDYIHEICNKQNSIYLTLLLDINMTCYKGEFLTKLTIKMGQLLLLDVDTGNDEKIIYKCFCKVRHENKEIDIAKYQIHFSFISTMDAEGEMLKILDMRSFLLMLIILMISSGSPHKSAKLEKYLSLKYAYEDAILYLLWCSGDVEINPGPTLKKLRPQADSVKKRNWIHEMCTTALKLLKNIALDSKSDGMWKEKPDNWQELHGDTPFYDPRNKPKGEQYSIKNDEDLLNCLFKCCDRMSIKLPCNLQSEITSWKSKNRDIALLLELYVSRQEIEVMKMAKNLLIKYADTPELKKYMKDNDCISFNQNSTQKTSPKGYSDVVRDLAITFCRVSKGLPIFEKSDGMWKTPPKDWNPNNLYLSPCNTAKRPEKNQDQKLVDDLLSYCEKKSKSIPPELQLVVNAWKLKEECKLGKSREICKREKSHKICKLEKNREICKHYTIWSSMAIIQHSIKYLEIEGLLEKPDVQQSLKEIGVSLHCEKGPKHLHCKSTVTTDYESEVSGLSYNSISDNLRDIHSSPPSSSASESDIVCSQHPYEAKASTNSQTMKSMIKCSKPDFQNHPSTSSCTIYSTLVPCPDSRGDLQYTDKSLDIPNSYKSVSEISCQEPDFQPSTSSCTIDSKRAPCRENSVDLQPRDDRDLSDSHKSLPEISCQEPDFQPSTSSCTIDSKRAPYRENSVDLQPRDDRDLSDSHKSLPEISCQEPDFQPSTSSCTIDSKRAPCPENSVDLQPRDDRDLSDSHKSLPEISCQEPDLQPSTSGCSAFNKRPECRNVRDKVPSTERIQKRSRPTSSEERLEKRPRLHSGNESQASITRCNGDTTPSSHCDSDIADQCVNSIGNMEDSSDQSSNRIPPDNIQDADSSKDQIFGPEDEIPQHLEEIIDRYIIMSFDNQKENMEENLEENLGDLENIDKLLNLWETL